MKVETLIESKENKAPILKSDVEHTPKRKYINKSGVDIYVEERDIKILNFLDSLGDCYVAGGAFKSILKFEDWENFVVVSSIYTNPRDYDIYFDHCDHFFKMRNVMKEKGIFNYENDNCICYLIPLSLVEGISSNYGTIKVELIKPKPYQRFLDRIDSFDLRACKIYFKGGEFKSIDNALEYLLKKDMKIDSFKNPIGTLNRVFKYYDYGFTITNSDLIKLSFHSFWYMLKNRKNENLFRHIKNLANIKNTYRF